MYFPPHKYNLYKLYYIYDVIHHFYIIKFINNIT